MALPLMLGICLGAGVACFLTDRATKAANNLIFNLNRRPPAPATSSDNDLNRWSPAAPPAPATSSDNDLNRWSPAAPATPSDDLNRRSPAAPATSSDNDLNCRSPAAPAIISPDNLNRLPPTPATLSDNLNLRPLAPATSSNNLNRRSPAAPATPSNYLNRRSPAAPATSSNNLNRRPPAPGTSSDNDLNCWSPAALATSSDDLNRRSPAAPATSSDNDLNCRSPAAPAIISPDNLNRLPPTPATLSDNLNPRPLAPATSSNNPVMHVGDMAAELAKYELCPLVDSTDAVSPVEVHLRTNIVEEVKINELSNGLAEGLENNDVFKGCLGDRLGAVTSVDNIYVISPLIEEADVLKLEEEAVNLSCGVIESGEGWWVAVKKWVEERFRWVKGKPKRWAEWPMLDPGVDMRRTLWRLVWVVVDSMVVESKYGIGHYRVLLKMYRILINELRFR